MNRFRGFLFVLLALPVVYCTALPAQTAPETFAITNARIFDGTRMLGKGTVVVRGGRIEAAGPDAQVPAGVATIDAAGGTLLPGLIDGHVHTWGDALVRALVFGVTSELDMFSSPDFARSLRAEQARPEGAPGRADLFSAGVLATAPGGHGTQFGLPIPTLTKPEEAQAWVDGRIAEGSDYIKIVSEDGLAYGRPRPSLDRATIAALIKAAHNRGKLAVVHVSTAERARQAIEDGADGLVHLFTDKAPDAGFARLAAEKKAFVIPTLIVLEATNGVAGGRSLPADLRLKPYLTADEATNLQRAFPSHTEGGMQVALDTVRQLRAAGVQVLAGSDAPNPGTAHGAALHRELEMLVQAGLTPAEALAAATSVPAKAFSLADRGRIAPGLRADLVLVAGDPTTDITATRNIVRIWKGGVPFERPLAPQPVAAAAPAAPTTPADGLISDFEDGLSAKFGFGWQDSTDTMRGGASMVSKKIVDGGAADSQRALEVSGELKDGFAFPWAGVIFFPGARPMAPVDLSKAQALEFWAKGEGKTCQVLFFASSLGMMPAQKIFTASPEWQRYTFPFTDFPGLDPKGILGIYIGGGTDLGAFRFQIDNVRLVPAN